MRPIPNTPSAGVALMAGAMMIAPFMDMFAKLLTEEVSPGTAALARFGMQTAMLLPVMLWLGQGALPGRMHAVAGACLGGAILCINMAVEVMPVPNAIAIFFVEPLIVTLLSVPILGERLGWRRLSAVALGLVGAMVVLRPNIAAFGTAALYPLGAAFFFAGYVLTMRVMSQRLGGVGLQFWTGLYAGLFLLVATLAGTAAEVRVLTLSMPSAEGWAMVVAMGLVSCIAHQIMLAAFARAEAGLIAPLQYLEIFSATLIGWAVWGDFPDALTWLGTAIIIAAGTWVFLRERQLARRRSAGLRPATAATEHLT